MTAIDIDKERESNDSSVSHESDKKYEKYGESNGENYEAYGTKNSSAYTPYKGQAVENVYDRYESDYEEEGAEQEPKSTTCTPKKLCCKTGWLLNMENRDGCS